MSTKRATILAALKAQLAADVSAVAGRVYLPWDSLPENDRMPYLQIELLDAEVDDSESIGQWLHRIPMRVGLLMPGKFDHAATWEIMAAVAACLLLNGTIAGAQRIDVTGCADSVTVAGERILWPHIAADLVYLTAAGSL